MALLVTEYLALSFLVDLPTAGASLPLVAALRKIVPIAMAAGAVGWLFARGGEMHVEHPAFHPWPALALQPIAFAGTAFLAYTQLRGGSTGVAGVLLVVAAATVAALLALATAAPLGFYARLAADRWRHPALATAAGILVWRAAVGAEGLWGALSGFTLRAAALLSRLGPFDVSTDPSASLLSVGGFHVRVSPECSGADGIGLVVLFVAVWISVARDRLLFPRAFLLPLLGAVAALAANVLRIATLMLAGAGGFAPLAMGGLHSKLGWVMFLGLAVGSVAAAEHTPWFRSASAPANPRIESLPPAASTYLAPLLVTLLASLLSGILTDGDFEPLLGLRAIAGGAALLALRQSLPRPAVSFSAVAILIGLGTGGLLVATAGAPWPSAGLAALSTLPRATWIALHFADLCAVSPVVEELAFRGFLMPWLVSSDFERVPGRTFKFTAVLLSSAVFAALHGPFLPWLVAGGAFAAARLHRGRLSDAIVAHAVAATVLAVAGLI